MKEYLTLEEYILNYEEDKQCYISMSFFKYDLRGLTDDEYSDYSSYPYKGDISSPEVTDPLVKIFKGSILYLKNNVNKTKNELTEFLDIIKDKKIKHWAVNEYLLELTNEQLLKFCTIYDELSIRNENIDTCTIRYICSLVKYPQLSDIISVNDERFIKYYNNFILSENMSMEDKIEKIKFGKFVCYERSILNLYNSSTDDTKSEISDISDILINFRKMCYYIKNCACGAPQHNLFEYLTILMTVPKEKRRIVVQYVLDSKYKSIYMTKSMCEYFSTLSEEDMELRFIRTKILWPDSNIQSCHVFEDLFVQLLKVDVLPTETELIELARKCTQEYPLSDKSICSCGYFSVPHINSVTLSRIKMKYYAPSLYDGGYLIDENSESEDSDE